MQQQRFYHMSIPPATDRQDVYEKVVDPLPRLRGGYSYTLQLIVGIFEFALHSCILPQMPIYIMCVQRGHVGQHFISLICDLGINICVPNTISTSPLLSCSRMSWTRSRISRLNTRSRRPPYSRRIVGRSAVGRRRIVLITAWHFRD